MTIPVLTAPLRSSFRDIVGHRTSARFLQVETAARHEHEARVVVDGGLCEVTTRAPLGVVLLACGTGCSARLVTDHVAAGLAMGNRVVLTFVESPVGELASLVAALARAFPIDVFHAVRGTGEAWNIAPEDVLVVAVLTPRRLMIDDNLHREGPEKAGGPDLAPLLRVFSRAISTTVPLRLSVHDARASAATA